MPKFYMDVHADAAITEQLRHRDVDVLTAQEDGADELDDEDLILRASEIDRLVFTQDKGFLAIARTWQRRKSIFSGVLFGRRQHSIGEYVNDLELIAKASTSDEWRNKVVYLPF